MLKYFKYTFTSILHLYILLSSLAGAVKYTNCISEEGQDSLNECPAYDSKQSDSEAPVILELYGMQGSPSLSLPGPLWPGEVAIDRVLSMVRIELNCNDAKLNCNYLFFNLTE